MNNSTALANAKQREQRDGRRPRPVIRREWSIDPMSLVPGEAPVSAFERARDAVRMESLSLVAGEKGR